MPPPGPQQIKEENEGLTNDGEALDRRRIKGGCAGMNGGGQDQRRRRRA